jgi:hypothetical protein
VRLVDWQDRSKYIEDAVHILLALAH